MENKAIKNICPECKTEYSVNGISVDQKIDRHLLLYVDSNMKYEEVDEDKSEIIEESYWCNNCGAEIKDPDVYYQINSMLKFKRLFPKSN